MNKCFHVPSVLQSLREMSAPARTLARTHTHTHTPIKEAELEPEWKNEEVSVKTSPWDAQNKMTFKTFFFTQPTAKTHFISQILHHSIIFNMGITILQNKYFPLLYMPCWYFFYPSLIL